MADADEKERMRALEKRLAEVRGRGAGRSSVAESHSQAQLGWRMVIELVSGLLVGFAIGYGLDSLFGTLPVLMVIFTLLGFAAGVRVMLRSAAEFQARETGAKDGKDEG